METLLLTAAQSLHVIGYNKWDEYRITAGRERHYRQT